MRAGVTSDVWAGVRAGIKAGARAGIKAGIRAGVRAVAGAGIRADVRDGAGVWIRTGVRAGAGAGIRFSFRTGDQPGRRSWTIAGARGSGRGWDKVALTIELTLHFLFLTIILAVRLTRPLLFSNILIFSPNDLWMTLIRYLVLFLLDTPHTSQLTGIVLIQCRQCSNTMPRHYT